MAEFERSGLTRKGFSEESGVALSTLDYWRRQVREWNDAAIVPVKIEAAIEAGREPLVMAELEMEPAATAAAGFRLSLPNGVRIEAGWSFPEAGLAKLLRAAAGAR